MINISFMTSCLIIPIITIITIVDFVYTNHIVSQSTFSSQRYSQVQALLVYATTIIITTVIMIKDNFIL